MAEAHSKKMISIICGPVVDSGQTDWTWCEDDLVARNRTIIKRTVPASLLFQQQAARAQASAMAEDMGNVSAHTTRVIVNKQCPMSSAVNRSWAVMKALLRTIVGDDSSTRCH